MKNGFTVKEASEYTELSQNTIYNMIKDGRLTAVMEDGNYKINTIDVLNAKSVKDIDNTDKGILNGLKLIKERAEEELKFKASRIFATIEHEIEKYNEYMNNEHANEMIKKQELFDDALNNNSKDLLEIHEELNKLMYKPYDLKGEIIINLKNIIDDYYEKYMFIKQIEEFNKYIKSNSMPFSDSLEFLQTITSDGGLVEGLKKGKIVVDPNKKRW